MKWPSIESRHPAVTLARATRASRRFIGPMIHSDHQPPYGEEDRRMLSREDNELLTRVDRGTPMGDAMRRYWIPALLAWELPAPDCPPVRVKLLGEELVAFRDSTNRLALLDEYCPHRRA